MALYNCDACATFIQAFQPRIQCTVCANFDLCANCAIGERFGDNSSHAVSHTVRTFKASGTAQGGQILAQAWIVYAANATNGTASSNPNSPAPPVPPRQTSAPPQSFNSNAYSQYGGQPQQPQQQSYGQPPQGWQPFFNPADMSQTATYITFMNAIFTHLDTSRSGYLTPETFSRFEEDMGYPTAENVWKSNLAHGPARADAALTSAYQLFGIEYTTHPRAPAPSPPARNTNRSSLSGFLNALTATPSMMSHMSSPVQPQPLLTRRGFADIAAVEFLSDPNKSFVLLLNLLRRYQLRELMPWGEMPRSVLPAEPDPRMLARVAGITERNRADGQNQLMAAAEAARIQTMANRVAVDAVGATHYEYRYV